jgi:hypothetical protein
LSPRDRVELEKREAADELRKFKETLHHKKHHSELKRHTRIISNEARLGLSRLAKATDEYLEELRRRKLGLGRKTPPQLMQFDDSVSVDEIHSEAPKPTTFVVDESDFRTPKRPRGPVVEKDFTLINAGGTVVKVYLSGGASSSVPPRKSRDSSTYEPSVASLKPSAASLKPNIVVHAKEPSERSVDRSKVQFRMNKYWNYRVRQDFSPQPSQKQRDALQIKAELSRTPVARRFTLVKLSEITP